MKKSSIFRTRARVKCFWRTRN